MKIKFNLNSENEKRFLIELAKGDGLTIAQEIKSLLIAKINEEKVAHNIKK